MKKNFVILAILICSTVFLAQIKLRGKVAIPTSSFERDTGRYAPTSIQVYLPSATLSRPQTSGEPC